MSRKETEEAIADSRAGRVSGRFATVGELLADLNADDDTPEIHEGSTNVYADLGYPDAAEMQAKARLVTKISQTIKARQLSNDQAATALGLTPAALRELLAGRFRAHPVDDLERLASVLDEARR
ncbi:TPA: XRE family transcriptional regulator [Pseudomonas aeruginosa]|jgi:predicted XRE-type DNA-binding protein|uniref:XRE family transcriptional regulator n=1 Tax=Pseudomonas aeruginosa TaxID=287 RepID=A0A1P8VNZ7_PSEAI|nr:XRE family transcriptional regulator [Pseudomonas aeruginosa]UKK37770.1 XRE family transcriptional regulator [Citrobacter freundii]APZ78346.1 XRE family transcriptional regulator [Pseudomonas aeruginosa]ERF04106.1 Fis family transcriptional regulator [Pseudomonas aeruginosa HB13]OVZ34198.1 Fis family transcriptional regulator [Pseudomonas aeruginosa]HBO5749363.1 XRE family transcriptional regulator [Pseudomonas aeruginosa]